MENQRKGQPELKQLTIGGQEVTVLVEPRIVRFGDTEKIVHKPRITTTHTLDFVEGLVGRDRMRHHDLAAYSPRDTEDEAVQAVVEGKGDIALVSALPDTYLADEAGITVLATIDATGTLPNSTLHLIGRKVAVLQEANATNVG